MRAKLIIFGLSNIAECAYEYFTHDSDYDVVAFTVDKDFVPEKAEIFGKPIVPFETIEDFYASEEHSIFVAIGSQQLNRLRTGKVAEASRKGYKLASYVSSRAVVWSNVQLGEHVFIQEDNTIQPFAKIGNNVTLWAGNHIGHASVIDDNCFVTSHVVISGHCKIGMNSFIGVNASIADCVEVGCDNLIGMGAIISKNTPENALYSTPKTEISKILARKFCKVEDV
ncbi:acetyltransferase [Thalassospira alkalitolerans]|uniref:Sugar O-acyltransferase n=1 Tax=Thalassospira alkalitolerans TaxID=1293890 RepID=A0A1Y2LC47_9PROT|nr:acetyltransferase [Thalassospira alkalitolerans]OSQ48367.1 sugar O-acyltransferase [Thalassospira alkalitolerans]